MTRLTDCLTEAEFILARKAAYACYRAAANKADANERAARTAFKTAMAKLSRMCSHESVTIKSRGQVNQKATCCICGSTIKVEVTDAKA
jgi:hypothetical protein